MSRGGYRPGAGRPKGSKSPLTIAREKIMRMCEEWDYDPIIELIEIAKSDDPNIPLKLRIDVHKELLSYIAPKLKSVEVKNTDDRQIVIKMVDFSSGGRE